MSTPEGPFSFCPVRGILDAKGVGIKVTAENTAWIVEAMNRRWRDEQEKPRWSFSLGMDFDREFARKFDREHMQVPTPAVSEENSECEPRRQIPRSNGFFRPPYRGDGE